MSSSNSDADPSAKAPEGLLEVGRIEKVHGLKGDVLVGLVTNMVEARTAAGSELWADGLRLSIVSARPHKNKWLMTFDGVTTREGAEDLRGRTLHAEPLSDDALASGSAEGLATEVVAFVHDLIGKRLIDQHGVDHGAVQAVIDNPAADLLELADRRLVPLSFYRGHDDRTISVDVPPGLLDQPDDAADENTAADNTAEDGWDQIDTGRPGR